MRDEGGQGNKRDMVDECRLVSILLAARLLQAQQSLEGVIAHDKRSKRRKLVAAHSASFLGLASY